MLLLVTACHSKADYYDGHTRIDIKFSCGHCRTERNYWIDACLFMTMAAKPSPENESIEYACFEYALGRDDYYYYKPGKGRVDFVD